MSWKSINQLLRKRNFGQTKRSVWSLHSTTATFKTPAPQHHVHNTKQSYPFWRQFSFDHFFHGQKNLICWQQSFECSPHRFLLKAFWVLFHCYSLYRNSLTTCKIMRIDFLQWFKCSIPWLINGSKNGGKSLFLLHLSAGKGNSSAVLFPSIINVETTMKKFLILMVFMEFNRFFPEHIYYSVSTYWLHGRDCACFYCQ